MVSSQQSSSSSSPPNPSSSDADSTTKPTLIRPFEWLTSPESLQRLIDEHVLVVNDNDDFDDNVNDDGLDSQTDNKDHDHYHESDKKHQSRGGGRRRRVLHIGCGSSSWGEHLLFADQHMNQNSWEKVVNVDRDVETMDQMEQRWDKLCLEQQQQQQQQQQVAELPSAGPSLRSLHDRMEFCTIDFTTTKLPFGDGYFDVILDKSTLDCTLCSDTATAYMLIEIYRTLSSNDGVYLIISFHEIELLLPLLKDLPGAQWTVEHTTMERQLERIGHSSSSTASIRSNEEENKKTTRGLERPEDPSQARIDGTNDHYPTTKTKPLNVLIIRKQKRQDEDNETSSFLLDYDEVCQHIHNVNDSWFQIQNPLLTKERIDIIRHAFQMDGIEEGKDSSRGRSRTNPLLLTLEEAYNALFTDAEREHLTMEHFVEDWDAFCCESLGGEKDSISSKDNQHKTEEVVSFELALKFLEFSQ
jgi:Methyltransferase domain